MADEDGEELPELKIEALMIAGDEPAGVSNEAIWAQLIYSIAGFSEMGVCILIGLLLFWMRVAGRMSWTISLLGSQREILDAAPGAPLFVVGVVVVFLTRFVVRLQK